MRPILEPKATIPETSSELTVVPRSGRTNGFTQFESSFSDVWVTKTRRNFALGICGPELAGGVPGYRDGLHTALGYGYRKTFVKRVASGRGIVTVAQKAGAVLVQACLRPGTDHVEMAILP